MRDDSDSTLASPRDLHQLEGRNEFGASAMFRIGKLLRDKKGVGAIEYALVAGMISLAAYSGYCSLGAKVQSHFDKINQALSTAM